MAEDTESQLLERINESLWSAFQVDKSTDVDNRETNAYFCEIYFSGRCA